MSVELDPEMMDLVAEKLASRIWEKIKDSIEDITLISIPRAAGMLDVSTSQTTRALEETVDMGPRNTKVSLKSLRSLVAKRTVLKKKKKGSRV